MTSRSVPPPGTLEAVRTLQKQVDNLKTSASDSGLRSRKEEMRPVAQHSTRVTPPASSTDAVDASQRFSELREARLRKLSEEEKSARLLAFCITAGVAAAAAGLALLLSHGDNLHHFLRFCARIASLLSGDRRGTAQLDEMAMYT